MMAQGFRIRAQGDKRQGLRLEGLELCFFRKG